MTSRDEFQDLKAAMDAATPAPDAARRADVLARAQANFEATQGSPAAARQSSVSPDRRGFFRGAFDMLMTKTTGALTATTALVAVGVLFLSPQGQELLNGSAPLVQEPVTGTLTDDEIAADPEPLPALIAVEEALEAAPEADAPVLPALSPAPRGVAPDAPAQAPQYEGIALTGSAELDVSRGEADRELGSNGAALSEAPAPFSPEDGVSIFTNGDFGTLTLGDTDGGFETGISQFGAGNSATILAPGDRRIQRGVIADVASTPTPDTEEFANADDNPLRVVADDPVSTFSIDVDTASYALLRSSLNRGQLPAPEAVRIEEMVNYFPYDYPAPDADDVSPFRPTVEVFATPWNPDTQLVHIGIQGELPAIEDRPPLNLVFLVDTSGSMNEAAKLPLLIQSFRLMLDRLTPEDQVAIVTYAGSAGVALEPTAASDTATISAALTALQAGGSTNGVGGLQAAYDLAAEMTEDGEVSRVLLATDGDFNVGISDPTALEDYIAEQRETGIYLSVLGFGRGNLQDDTMQALAQNGNGTAAFIDTLHEAQRVLVDQLAGALFPIADDLKVQVEFNPEAIAEYRLIGYETRALAREDFANDAVDAGELGAGHSVTAIYEVTPVGSPAQLVAPLRYATDDGASETEFGDELGFISLRWKEPGEDDSTLIDFPIAATPSEPGTEAQFAAAIAGFGQLLRGNAFLGDWGYEEAIALANASRGEDEFGYRTEAIQLMRLAQSLTQ